GLELGREALAQLAVALCHGPEASALGQRAHEAALGGLAQRIGRDGEAPETRGRPAVAAGQCTFRQRFERLQVGLAAALALLEHPVLGAALEQRTAVERDRAPELELVNAVGVAIERQ